MKSWRSSQIIKMLSFLLSIVMITALVLSFVSTVYMAGCDVYGQNASELKTQLNAQNTDIYSVIALAKRNDPTVKANFTENTHFRYGIIKADSLEDVKLSDPSVYVDYNFTKLPDENAVVQNTVSTRSYEIGPDTQYTWDARLFGNVNIYTNTGDNGNTDEISTPIIGYYYDIDSGVFLYETQEALYRVDTVALPLGSDGGMCTFEYDAAQRAYYNTSAKSDCVIEDYYLTFNTLDDTEYNWQTWDEILLDEDDFSHADIKFGHLQGSGTISEDFYLYTYDNTLVRKANAAELLEAKKAEQKNSTYYVISMIDDQDMGINSEIHLPYIFGSTENYVKNGDLFDQTGSFVNTAYTCRYIMIFVMIASGLLWIYSLNLVVLSAGYRRKDDEEECISGNMQRIPFDLLSVVFSAVIAALIGAFLAVIYNFEMLRTENIVGATAIFMVGYAVGLVWLIDFSIRVKLGKWWRNTLIYKFLQLFVSPIRKLKEMMRENTNLSTRISVIYGVLVLCELVGIGMFSQYNGGLYFIWFIEKIVFYPVILMAALQIDRIKNAGKKMADGDLESEVDTKGMFWDFKIQAEHLNSIRAGMGNAVEERMKSERFKTELITNVSHDIKTPLTSIINYVDLLEKENLEHPKAEEYLEVLDRQSARLKKLIEDLLEASKASTGNMEVHLEKLEVGVFLEQTVGEFQEKLEAKGLQVVIQKPEEPLEILADGRHLWRVVDNLFNNICKYAQPNTRVYIDLSHQTDQVELSFKNISANQLNISGEELMERFVRGDSSRNTEGSGLGLSIAQSLTELMGGTMKIHVDGDLFKVILHFSVEK